MCEVSDLLEQKFPCRNEVIKKLTEFIGFADEAFPAALYLFGHSGTGKTALLKEFLRLQKRNDYYRASHLNCIECYTLKVFFENILDDLLENDDDDDDDDDETPRCDTLNDFITILRKWSSQQLDSASYSYVIALDNAERLRGMDANLLPSLLRLQELTGLNICVVLTSQLPFEKYYNKSGLSHVIRICFPQYTKTETLRILSADFNFTITYMLDYLNRADDVECGEKMQRLNAITIDFYNNYLNVFLSVFYKACRDLPELKLTARKCFATYVEPVLDGSIALTDVSRLWRNIAGPLRTALSQVYMRLEQPINNNMDVAQQNDDLGLSDQSVRKMAQSLELPYYAKYLLIAAFLASYNSAKEDKRLFVKNHGKQRKRVQSMNAKAKVTEKMSTTLGPKSFTIDRLLAIFYAILEEKVGLTCNLLSQIQTLVDLKLLCFASGENNVIEGSARLQCTVSLEFIIYIGKVVGFNVRQYLCDFT